jgi:hypothetical protein
VWSPAETTGFFCPIRLLTSRSEEFLRAVEEAYVWYGTASWSPLDFLIGGGGVYTGWSSDERGMVMALM